MARRARSAALFDRQTQPVEEADLSDPSRVAQAALKVVPLQLTGRPLDRTADTHLAWTVMVLFYDASFQRWLGLTGAVGWRR